MLLRVLKKISNKFHQGALTLIMIFACIALKPEKVGFHYMSV